MDYMEIANSPAMWIVCLLAASTVPIQAVIFLRKALKVSESVGINQAEIKKTVRITALASLGPIAAICAGVLSLLVSMGGPFSYLRLGFIGSVGYEISSAGFGVAAMGTLLRRGGFWRGGVLMRNGRHDCWRIGLACD